MSATSEASANHSPYAYEYTTVTKLFVGNLPFTATEASVRTLFAAHGTIESIALIMDRDTGRPRGFGFIELSSADAARAIQALNGKDFEGRALKVNEAQERERAGGPRR
jgi:cold-inducible RNA-binding protein